MAWIASHKELLSHPKTLDLMEAMGWDVDQCVAKLHRLWWWCVDYAEDGDLRKHNDDRIARAVGLNGGNDATRFVEGLVTARWLDREPYFRIHDWWDYYGHFLRGKYSKTPEKWQRIRDLYSPSVNHTVTSRLPFTTEPNQTKQNQTKQKEKEKEKPLPPEKPPAVPRQKPPPKPPPPNGDGASLRPLTDVQRVVLGFKAVLGVADNDVGWDKVYYPRYSKPAKELLTLFEGNLDRVADCIDQVSAVLERKKLSWTPETLVKHAGDWKNGRLFK